MDRCHFKKAAPDSLQPFGYFGVQHLIMKIKNKNPIKASVFTYKMDIDSIEFLVPDAVLNMKVR